MTVTRLNSCLKMAETSQAARISAINQFLVVHTTNSSGKSHKELLGGDTEYKLYFAIKKKTPGCKLLNTSLQKSKTLPSSEMFLILFNRTNSKKKIEIDKMWF